MGLPAVLADYACGRFLSGYHPAYFQVDFKGRVLSWDGPLDHYRLAPPAAGEKLADCYFFMEGLLPLDRDSLRLPYVQIAPHVIVDLHLVRGPDCVWVLILDAAGKAAGLAPLKQVVNEIALERLGPGTDQEYDDYHILMRMLPALDIAGLQWIGHGRFRLLGRAPGWLVELWPQVLTAPDSLNPAEAFPFLANFLLDAGQFWENAVEGRLESGLWSETDSRGREYLLEAAAVVAGQARVLAIESERGLAREKRAVLQKGRDLALNYHLLNRMEKELEARVRERTRELEIANQRLADELEARARIEKERAAINAQLQQVQKMEAIGTLASGIAHDFNNILSAVIGFAEIALYDVPDSSPLRRNLEQVLKAGCRARDLVRQILTFSRQNKPEKKPVQLNLVTAEALKFIRASLPATIQIVQELNSKALVMADPTQLHQVVMNLATNAGQAMAADGGTLTVKLTDCHLGQERAKVLGTSPGQFVCLEVRDTGCGIPAEVMARIFDPFFTTKQKDQGTGMGLSVVHGIVKSCSGGIQVASDPGKGTAFKVFFPVMKTVAADRQDLARDLPTGSERILVIDDEQFQVDLMRQILVRLGYQVVTATDSGKGLDLFAAAAASFDLVITDMTMPKMTGLQLAAKIQDYRPAMPVVLCSGFSESMVYRSRRQPSISAYLMKPIVMEQLAATVRQVLDSCRREDGSA